MYKVLIVDDEKMIRMGMKKVLPWQELKIEEVYTAASGKEALGILEEYHPQIMISDIQMTGMTGLELIEKAKEKVPDLRVIVLTGYDNFEYARQSIRLEVQDFFLKPIDEEDLAEAVKKQVDYLDEQKQAEKTQPEQVRTQGFEQQNRLEHYLRSLVHQREEKETILNDLKEHYHFDFNQSMKMILIVPTLYMNRERPEENFRAMSVKHICMGMVDSQGKGITFTDDEGVIAIVYFEIEEGESIIEEVQQLSNVLSDEFDVKPKMVMGSTVQGFSNLMVSYNDARYLLENEKENICDIIQNFGAESKSELFLDVYAELKGIMCNNIGNSEYVLKVFRTFSKAVESYNLSKTLARRCCFEIASTLLLTYMGDSGEVEDGKLDALSKNLVSAGREEACELTEMFITNLLGKGEENVHDIVSSAKRYIDEHLAEDLSVSSIANNLYITPNYFSRLFKRVTKEGCNEYIVRKRIEKAKSLLETTSIKTGKIAMMVGYRDTNYFSLAFKKHTGKSPTKYREEIQGGV